jgi:hypothetical protein
VPARIGVVRRLELSDMLHGRIEMVLRMNKDRLQAELGKAPEGEKHARRVAVLGAMELLTAFRAAETF